jgi:signal transduction histidine kinase
MNIAPRQFLENELSQTSLREFNKGEGFPYNTLPIWLELEEVSETGVWYWDYQNKIQYWSDGFYRFLNREKHQGAISIFEAFKNVSIHPDDIDTFCAARAFVITEKKSITHEYRIIEEDGNIRYVKARISVQLDDHSNIKFIVGIESDTTKTQQAIQELKEYKKNVTANETFLRIGNWELDIKTRKISLSDSLKKLLKYPDAQNSENIDFNEWIAKHVTAADSHLPLTIEERLKKFQGVIIDSVAIIDSEGNEINVQVLCKLMMNDRGMPIKVIGTMKDISELKESERKLELKVEELNRSNRELEEFAYIASHDLQEPIRKLITFSERIESAFGDEIPPNAMIYLEKMSKAAFNMRTLIENLLEFSRVTRVKTNFQQCSLKQLFEDVLQDLELKIEETNAEIVYSDLPAADVVPHQLKQLFHNLLGNALKFRKKEVPLKVEVSHYELTTEELKEKKLNIKVPHFCIEIKDNGIGFEQEYEEKVFQVFQRLNGKSEYPGTGIGLSICRKVMSFHKGLIYVKSQLGTGSTFYLIFPYEQVKF